MDQKLIGEGVQLFEVVDCVFFVVLVDQTTKKTIFGNRGNIAI